MNITITDISIEEFIKIANAFATPLPIVQEENPVKKKAKPIKKESVSVPEDTEFTATVTDIAEMFGVTRASVNNWSNSGLPYKAGKVGNQKCKLYNKELTAKWFEENRKNNAMSNKKRGKTTKKKETTSFTEWQRSVFAKIDGVGKDRGKICSAVFRKMNKQYGIVWDQEKKDFYKENGYSPSSTIQLAYWIQTTKPACKNLFDCCLDTVLAEAVA